MTTYAWPGFPVNRFEMRIIPNQRTFVGPYTPTTQVLDLLGERWMITLTLPPTARSSPTAAALEAFWNRLKGQANLVSMGHLVRPSPAGTMGGPVAASWTGSAGTASWTGSGGAVTWLTGDPVVDADIPQLATTGYIRTLAGATLLAGDMIGLGGQLVQIMANATADSSGRMAIEFQPRARNLIPAYSAVTYSAPTANFMLKPGTSGVPTVWTPDYVEGASIELIEVY